MYDPWMESTEKLLPIRMLFSIQSDDFGEQQQRG
jgi:hypothetical protein